MTDIWPVVHAERAALIADLETLTPEQWATPSLCEGWDVHDVLAHLVDVARTTRLGFVLAMARARFDFDRQNADGLAAHRGATPTDTLAAFRAVRTWTATPPAPLETRLGEAFVHGEDIRRPLGLRGSYPTPYVVRSLALQVRTDELWGGGKQRVAGVTLQATDAEYRHGDGPVVEGPALALLLVTCGRSVALDELSGPGLERLAARP
ncbi:MAG: maleylpyruvate isomerase family mycothiol-dependent enzyme [Pseudonocardia sp.]